MMAKDSREGLNVGSISRARRSGYGLAGALALLLSTGPLGSLGCTGGLYASATNQGTESDGDSESTGTDTNGGGEDNEILCDPVLQACDMGESCLPIGNGFDCQAIDLEADKADGDICEVASECRPGLMCLSGPEVAECTGAFCCTSWCDLNDENACGGLEICEAWFLEPPLGGEHIGVCSVP